MDPRVIPEIDNAGDEPFVLPEQRMWAAVVLRAWLDSFVASDWQLVAGENDGADAGEIRRDARRWLTMTGDCDYARDRQEVCDYAEISEPWLRGLARKRLEMEREADAEREAESHAKAVARIDGMFERLLASEASGLHPGRVNQYLNRLAELEAETV